MPNTFSKRRKKSADEKKIDLEEKAKRAGEAILKIHEDSSATERTAPTANKIEQPELPSMPKNPKREPTSFSLYPEIAAALDMAAIQLKTAGKQQGKKNINKSFIVESLIKLLTDDIATNGVTAGIGQKIIDRA